MIVRDPPGGAARDYDAIVVGGGVHGCMAFAQGALSGRRMLLLERADFGGATSFNSLRIIHGGLRYLQTLDLARFFESVAERRWFLRTYPDLVKPLPCVMPLYNDGLKRSSVMRVALALNDALSVHRNAGVRHDRHLPRGRIMPARDVRKMFPFVRTDRLAGAALWYDACVPDSHRVVMETIRWGTASGGTALNYVDVKGLDLDAGEVRGVEAYDRIGQRTYRFRAPVVINAAGPWCDEVLGSFGQAAAPTSFSIAWNILFDRPATSDHAVALTPPGPGAQTYFLHPWKGRLLIGTGHRAWTGDPTGARPSEAQIDEFIADVDAAAPGLGLSRAAVTHVFCGLLPSAGPTHELTHRPEIRGYEPGARGLYSMVGIKFTTSRRTAAKTLELAGLRSAGSSRTPAPPAGVLERSSVSVLPGGEFSADALATIDTLAATEAVCSAEDLVLRRLGMIHDPAAARHAAATLRSHVVERFVASMPRMPEGVASK
jgi:glycerol-3-phosphate dehydrogenase